MNHITMIAMKCQETDCRAVYGCKIKSENLEFEAQCKKCTFETGCDLREKADSVLLDFGICKNCYQRLMDAH